VKRSRYTTKMLIISALLMVTQPVLANPLELTLEDSVNLALKNSHGVKMAAADKEKALWEVEESKGNKGFSLTYTNTNMRSTEPPTYVASLAAVSPYNYFSHKLTLAVPLYSGGKLENAVEAQKLGSKVANLSFQTSKQDIKLEATTDFYQVLATRNMVNVTQQSVDALTNHQRNVERQFEVGVVAKADVLRTKVQVANVEDNLIKAQNNYEMAVYRLNHVMGLPLRGELKLKAELKYDKYPLTMDDSINYALKHRLEVDQVKTNLAIAETQMKIAKGEKRPTVNLVGTNVWNNIEYPGTDYSHWTAALIAEWNILDSGVGSAKIEKAKYALIKAREQVKEIGDNITLEASQAYLSLKEAEKRIETSKVAVEEAQTNFTVALKRYNSGIGINLDVIDAELALNTAKTNNIQALYDYNVSRARLDKAIGVSVE